MKKLHGSLAYNSQQTISEMVEDAKTLFQPAVLNRQFWTELLQTYLTDTHGEFNPDIFKKTEHEQIEIWLIRYELEKLHQKEQEIIALVEKVIPTLKFPLLNLWIFIDSVCDQYHNQVPERYMYLFKTHLIEAVRENSCSCCGKPL